MNSVNCSVLSNADNATIVGLEGGGGCTPTSINVHPDCVTLRVDCHGHNIPSKEKRNATVKPRQFSEISQVMGELRLITVVQRHVRYSLRAIFRELQF